MVTDRVVHLRLSLCVRVIDLLFMEITASWWSSWAIPGSWRLQPAAGIGSDATQASVNTAVISPLSAFSFPHFWFFPSLSYKNQNGCQEPPLTSSHSWGTAPVYVIPHCLCTHMMLYCRVNNCRAFRNCREPLQLLKLLSYRAIAGSRKVCSCTFKPRAAFSGWQMTKKLTSSFALLIWSIYLFHHFIKFVTCILVYTQELWQLKMADVSV